MNAHEPFDSEARAAAGEVSRDGPPAIPFVLAVGITGHRAEVLAEGDVDRLRERIRETLILIEESGRSLLDRERDCFASRAARLRFVSPIADGADQIAATLALELGWELQAIIPFSRDQYRASLANDNARERFDALLERSVCVLDADGFDFKADVCPVDVDRSCRRIRCRPTAGAARQTGGGMLG